MGLKKSAALQIARNGKFYNEGRPGGLALQNSKAGAWLAGEGMTEGSTERADSLSSHLSLPEEALFHPIDLDSKGPTGLMVPLPSPTYPYQHLLDFPGFLRQHQQVNFPFLPSDVEWFIYHAAPLYPWFPYSSSCPPPPPP